MPLLIPSQQLKPPIPYPKSPTTVQTPPMACFRKSCGLTVFTFFKGCKKKDTWQRRCVPQSLKYLPFIEKCCLLLVYSLLRTWNDFLYPISRYLPIQALPIHQNATDYSVKPFLLPSMRYALSLKFISFISLSTLVSLLVTKNSFQTQNWDPWSDKTTALI